MKDANKKSLSPQSLQEAMSSYKSGKPLVAEELYRKILLDDPKNITALHMLGIIVSESGRYDEAVALLGRAIKIRKGDSLLLFTLGMTLQKAGKPEEALLKYKMAVSLKPDYVEAHTRIGDILKNQDKFDTAELAYKRVIALKPDHVAAHYCLGQVLKKQDKLDEAVLAYQQTIALKPDHAEAYNNLGVIFNEQRKYEDAVKMYEQALSVKPDYDAVHVNLDEAHSNLHAELRKGGLINEAIIQYEQRLVREPDSQQILASLVDFIYNASAWEKMGDHEARLLDMVRQKRAGMSPFFVLTTPATAEEQLTYVRSCASHAKQPEHIFTHTQQKSAARKPDDRIKIGYFSSDLRDHAVSHLIVELFERHDRSRFSVNAYSYGPGDKSPLRKRLMKAFDSFVDIDELTDREAAQKIYDDGVDILVDLTGCLMNHGRGGISACRPTPLQVNYLGYPGTMGVDPMDYIIADRFIIPEDQEKFYSEKVVCLPDCYQPNDTHRKIAETPTRQACGLPAQGFVFCCFNANYKIRPQMFDIWMRLLQKIPGSVLWMLEMNHSVKGNLRREAERRGVDPERIIFAPKIPSARHLARQRLADLFLDTLPVNAHTTTSDALWAGLPVLTCVGSTFAGRVAGSLLKAADLPELITYSLEDYETLALHLAQNPARLSEIRQKLERTRLQVPLFDIERFTRNIEKSYQTMFDIWQAGEKPKAFSVT